MYELVKPKAVCDSIRSLRSEMSLSIDDALCLAEAEIESAEDAKAKRQVVEREFAAGRLSDVGWQKYNA